MSHASTRDTPQPMQQHDRRPAWIAASTSALVHLAILAIALFAPTPVPTPPQGSASGSVVEVDFIGESDAADPIPPVPPSIAQPAPERPQRAPLPADTTPSRVRTTLTLEADQRVSQDASPPASASTPALPPVTREPRPSANPQPTTAQRARVWGQPPGMVAPKAEVAERGRQIGLGNDTGYQRDPTISAPSMALGGYHVYYDLSSETQLRAWQAEGMTEIFIPLPGTRQLMACPLEIALKRDSGRCRAVEPDDPGLARIGDGRKVIRVQQVHHRGKRIWNGPGPYR